MLNGNIQSYSRNIYSSLLNETSYTWFLFQSSGPLTKFLNIYMEKILVSNFFYIFFQIILIKLAIHDSYMDDICLCEAQLNGFQTYAPFSIFFKSI